MLIEKATQFERAASLESLWQLALDSFRAEGLAHVIYIMSDQGGAALELRTNVPQLYTAADPARDPFLQYCCSSYEATRTGVSYLPDYDYLPPEAKVFIRGAEKVGFRSGFGIPVRLEGSARFGGFNLGTGLERDEFEARFADRLTDLQAFCLLLHRRLDELGSAQTRLLGSLSPREREILMLICNGASRKEAALELGLSPNTVADYSKSAYRKLGVRNRAQAARHIFGT